VLCVASSFAVCDAAPAGGMKVQRMLVSLGSLRVVRVQLPAGPKFLVIPRNSRAKNCRRRETSVLCNVQTDFPTVSFFLHQSNEFLTFLYYHAHIVPYYTRKKDLSNFVYLSYTCLILCLKIKLIYM
jgi:hypothetical protein